MKKLFVLTLLFTATAAVAQSTLRDNTWKTLSKITFKKEYDEVLGLKIDVPVFGKEVKALEGKEVTIKGYIIPTDGYKNQSAFVFSAFPYNMCFFCGGAGPETVIEVNSKQPIIYTSEPIYLKGILVLNGADVNRLIYSLEKAQKL
ncbi:MAG: hypothetical protein U5L45_15380 [Saprospiraceae bacterium]|nr:hypothetical protein [Saprospiraceae bacterium]